MALNLPKLPKLTLSKLQALLLLGGAFVLAVLAWTVFRYRLVLDRTPEAPAQSIMAMQFLSRDTGFFSDAKGQKLVSALPPEAQQALKQAAPGQEMTIFAVPGDGETVQWGLLEALNVQPAGKPVWKLVPREDDAIGFLLIEGKKQPFEATFGAENAIFRVGRTYRGIIGDGPTLNIGRRMRVPLNQQMFYLEKPESASWTGASALLGQEMRLFPALSAFWTLPGRVELSVSASHTASTLQPFSLYYRPIGTAALPRTMLETYAKELLADALPHPIQVQLPDGSHMLELRHDSTGVQATQQQNQFGDIVKFSFPGQKEGLYAFYAKDGEAWLTTDLNLVQAVMLGNINASISDDICHKGGSGGFAMVPGTFLPVPNGFKDLTVSIHNLETGLFTICGYY